MAERRILHKVKYYRSKYRITQKEMAKMLEMSHSNYANIENGRTAVDYDTMLGIKAVFNEKAKEHGDCHLTLDEIFCD